MVALSFQLSNIVDNPSHITQLLRLLSLGGETITSRIQDPGVVVGTLHTGEETDGLSWQLPGGQRTSIG